MKKSIIYSTVFLILLSCSEKVVDPYFDEEDEVNYTVFDSGEEQFGYAKAKVNGHKWRASAYYDKSSLFPDSIYYLSFRTFETQWNILREVIGVGRIGRYNTGNYCVLPYENSSSSLHLPAACKKASMGIFQDDGDVMGAYYQLDSTYSSWIDIEEWDPHTEVMKGTFELAFVRTHVSNNLKHPERILFEDGYFECVQKQ